MVACLMLWVGYATKKRPQASFTFHLKKSNFLKNKLRHFRAFLLTASSENDLFVHIPDSPLELNLAANN